MATDESSLTEAFVGNASNRQGRERRASMSSLPTAAAAAAAATASEHDVTEEEEGDVFARVQGRHPPDVFQLVREPARPATNRTTSLLPRASAPARGTGQGTTGNQASADDDVFAMLSRSHSPGSARPLLPGRRVRGTGRRHRHRGQDQTPKPPPWLLDKLFPAPKPNLHAAAAAAASYGGTSPVAHRRQLLQHKAAGRGSTAAAGGDDGKANEKTRQESGELLQGLLNLPHGVLRGNDADDLLQRVYEYYREQGFAVAMARRVLNSVMLGFVVLFSAFLMAGVDWAALLQCGSGSRATPAASGSGAATVRNCSDASHFVSARFLSRPQGAEWLVLVYVVALGIYWGWSVAVLPSSALRFWSMSVFFRDWLRIPDSTLPATPWESVVAGLETLARSGTLPLDGLGLGVGVEPATATSSSSSSRSGSGDSDGRDGGAGERAVSEEDGEAAVTKTPQAAAGKGVKPADDDGKVQADGMRAVAAASPLWHASPDDATLSSTHGIACRITRKDNYLVALAADGELDVDAAVSVPVTPTACVRWLWKRRAVRVCWKGCVRRCARLCDAQPADVDVSAPTREDLREKGVPLWEDFNEAGARPRADDKAAAVVRGRPRLPQAASVAGDTASSKKPTKQTAKAEDEDEEEEREGLRGNESACCSCRRGWLTLRVWLPLTRTVEAHTRFALLRPMFGEDMRVRRHFLRDEAGLQRSFRLQAAAHLLVMPFALAFAAVFWVLALFEEARSNQQYLGARVWSPHAQWLFREYNELPHALARRCATAAPHAERYLRQFPSPLLEVVGRFVSFVAGALLAALLTVTVLVDDQLLTEMQLGGRNLLWFVAVLSAAVAAGRSLVPSPEDRVVSPRAALLELAADTHHFPGAWRGSEHTAEVRESVLSLFPNRAVLALRELAAIVLAPVVLWVVLPHRAPRLLQRMRELTADGGGSLGHVCKHALLVHGTTPGLQQPVASSRNHKEPGDEAAPAAAASEQKAMRSAVAFHCQNPRWSKAQAAASQALHASVANSALEQSSSMTERSVVEAAERMAFSTMFESSSSWGIEHVEDQDLPATARAMGVGALLRAIGRFDEPV